MAKCRAKTAGGYFQVSREQNLTESASPNIAPPPRRLPLLVWSRVLLGGPLTVFGLILLGGFGMLFLWLLIADFDPAGIVFGGRLETATAEVTDCADTGIRRDNPDGSGKVAVYAISYSFAAPGGGEVHGVSYSIGKPAAESELVTVEYPAGRPWVSRIRGMQRTISRPWAFFAVLFSGGGLLCLVPGLVRGWKACKLLRKGMLAVGKAVATRPTGTHVDFRPVHAVQFEFETEDGRKFYAVAVTHQPEKLAQYEYEGLLYDPDDPSYAAMIGNLPGSPQIDIEGNVTAGSRMRGILALAVPAVLAAANLVAAAVVLNG